MSPRPPIFVSAVSQELKSARDIVAKHLLQLGYEPVWQDLFGTEQGDVRQMLREKIEPCVGVLQLLGHRYGFESPEPDPQFGRTSYTQFEPLYGKLRGKKVWYLLLDATFPTDSATPEPSELRELQRAYRERVQADSQLYHPIATVDGLRAAVLGMRDDLAALRRGWKVWAYSVAALLVVSVGLALWLVKSGRETKKEVVETHQTATETKNAVSVVDQKQDQLLAAIRGLAQAFAQTSQTSVQSTDKSVPAIQASTPADENARLAQAYTALEQKLHLPAGTLAKELPGFAQKLAVQPDASPLDIANALYALKDFAGAEKAALLAKEQALAGSGNHLHDAIAALNLAGWSAENQAAYARALEYFRAAAAFTSRERDLREWGQAQYNIASVLLELDRNAEAEPIIRDAIAAYTSALGPEDADTLDARNTLATILFGEERYAEAETEHRALGALEARVLGPTNRNTLFSRGNLANVLMAQGKLKESEDENRAIIPLMSQVLGPEDPKTLMARMNLAAALATGGQGPAAEKELRSLLALRERISGPNHPDTLRTRSLLAVALSAQDKDAEAEPIIRATIPLLEQTLGETHTTTLSMRSLLGTVLGAQGKLAEAEKVDRETLAICERALGAEKGPTLSTRYALALNLYDQKKYAESEKQQRLTLAGNEHIHGPDHPSVFWSCSKLGWCLLAEGKHKEAGPLAQRALAGFKAHDGTNSEGYQNALDLSNQLKSGAR